MEKLFILKMIKLRRKKPFPKQKYDHVFLNTSISLGLQIALLMVNVLMNLGKFWTELLEEPDIQVEYCYSCA